MTALTIAWQKGFPLFFLPAVLGGLIGACVAFDPPLSYLLAGVIDTSAFGKSPLLLYPYQLISMTLLFVVCLLSAYKWFNTQAVADHSHVLEKFCIVVLLIASQTFALTSLGTVDGYDLVTALIFLVFLLVVLPATRTVVLTRFDSLNLLLVTAYVISFATSGMHPLYVFRILLLVKLIMLSILIVNFLRNEELVRFFILTMITVTTVSAVIGIGQEALYVVTGETYVGIVDTAGMKYSWESTPLGTLLRVPAFVMSYKTLVFLLVVNLAIILNLLLHTALVKSQRWLLSVAAILMLFCLTLTFSKDGFLGFFVVVTLSLLMRWRSAAIYGLLLIIALGLLVYVLGYWDDIVSAAAVELTWGEYRLRVQLDREGVIGLLEEPALFALGPGTLYTSNHLGWPAHNNWILAANQIGLYGFIVYLLIVAYTLYNLAELPVYAPGTWLRGLSKGVTTGFVGLLVVFQTHAGYLDPILWIVMILAQALVLIGRSSALANSRFVM